MSKITTAKVVNVEEDRVVSEFSFEGEAPKPNDTVAVPDNGDVGYHVLGRRFDYSEGEVRLKCRKATDE